MPVPFIMPKFDMDQENATVVEWLKDEGDSIELDEPVLTVETDKVAIEVPAPATGKLARIKVGPGDVVPVTTVIAYVLEQGESEKDLPAELQDQMEEAVEEITATVTELSAAEEIPQHFPSQPVSATPVALRMAREMGIDLSAIPVSGEKVTKADIESFLRSEPVPISRVKVSATPAAKRLSQEIGVELMDVPGSGPGGRIQAEDVQSFAATSVPAVLYDGKSAERVPLAGIRRTIADRMQTSFQTAPHIALTVDVDMTNMEAVRLRMNLIAEKKGERRISVTALLVRIIAWVLENNPYINASLVDDTIYLWRDINIGVATALEDGLIVPVIRSANQKSVSEINQELKDLSSRAREGNLTLDEVKAGTFTLTNLGMFGINQFRAIINPPESAILAVGKVVRKPVVINEKDDVEIRPMMSMTLSADHRVIDGVVAAKFLQELVMAVESPDVLLY